MSRWLVDRATTLIGSRSTRRSFLKRTAFTATALAVAPTDLLLRPTTAFAAICGCNGSSCDCSALCCDGYTEFCCTLHDGVNSCPVGTFAGGWWKADGSIYCSGARYYIDCMAECTHCTTGCGASPFCDIPCDDVSCGCALGSCNYRHAGCTFFRYGQCHQEISCSGRIACRVVSCTPPWLIDSTCTQTSATDDNTANQNAPCLEAPPPPPPPVWHAWAEVAPEPPAGMQGAPGLASWGPGRLDVFVRGGDDNLWHCWSADGGASYHGWEPLTAPPPGLASSPAAVSWGPGRIDVFVRGADAALWHKCWTGQAWSGWESRGGTIKSAPAVASWAPNRLDIIGIGPDGGVRHICWDTDAWSGWERRGGDAIGDPGAVSWGPNRLDIFVLGTDHLIWHQYWQGSAWSGWFQDVPGTWASGPAAAAWAPGRIDLFGMSPSPGHPLGHAFYAGALGWHTETLGGYLASSAAASSWGFQHLDVLVEGLGAALWRISYSSP